MKSHTYYIINTKINIFVGRNSMKSKGDGLGFEMVLKRKYGEY
jgi:hypothetical protein